MKYLIILLSVCMMSCGARKVHKEVIATKEEVSMMTIDCDTTSTHIDEVHNTITSIDVIEEDITITPIDSSKDMKVDNKTYKNVKIKRSSKKDKTIIEDKDTTKIDSSSSERHRLISLNIKEGSVKIKSTEKEQGQSFYFYSLLFLFLLALLIFLANKLKKYLL